MRQNTTTTQPTPTTPPTPTSNIPHNCAYLWAICKEFGVGLKFETTPETYSYYTSIYLKRMET